VGVWEWEKRITQKIIVDLDMASDIAKSAATDELDDTLNYKAVGESVIEMLEASRFQLIETMAEEVAKLVMTKFSVAWVRVRINKGGAVKHVANVGVEVERGKR
jgi:dihydroneopterin aldolase